MNPLLTSSTRDYRVAALCGGIGGAKLALGLYLTLAPDRLTVLCNPGDDFEHLGLTPKIHAGAADMYRLVGATHLADRNPEDPEPLPSLSQMIAVLAARLPSKQAKPRG